MIGIWIAILGFISTLQIITAAPVTETKLVSQPTSQPIPALLYGQHKGGFGPIEESDMSILCQSCQENDIEIPSISEDMVAAGVKRNSVPTTALAIKRARKPTPVCSYHNTRKPRSYCLKCQIDGTGGGALCIGGHGKRKYNCKECHPDEYAANRKSDTAKKAMKREMGLFNCLEHSTGKPKWFCIECQQAGTGGGGLCIGGHGRQKRDCKKCHPVKHAANLTMKKEKYKKMQMVMNEAPGERYNSNDANDGINISLSSDNLNEDESTGEKFKCVCGNELNSKEDPICAECATNLKSMLE